MTRRRPWHKRDEVKVAMLALIAALAVTVGALMESY